MCAPPIYPQLPHFHNHGLDIPFHFIWKEISKECFSSFIIKIPKASKRQSIEKEREREKRYWKKEEGKEKLQVSLQIKWGSQYFERRKTSQLQNLFTWVHFLPLHHTIFKTLPKIIRESFIALLDHPLTWQYAWLELYHLSLLMSSTYLAFRGLDEKRNIYWVEVRKHTPKLVPDCLRLRNHIISVTIFSPIDFKKRPHRRDTDERFHL
jgi:hypothetical protein